MSPVYPEAGPHFHGHKRVYQWRNGGWLENGSCFLNVWNKAIGLPLLKWTLNIIYKSENLQMEDLFPCRVSLRQGS